MDGTLLDTVEDIADALNGALLANGYPTHDPRAVASFLGSGAYHLVQRAMPAGADHEAITRVTARFKAEYDKLQDTKTHPYPGILPMLTALDEAGMKLAIISNKTDPNVRALTKAHFGSLIHVAVGSRDDVPIKPAPDMLYHAMERLQVVPERVLYIGDSQVDYETAQRAGADCILARWGYGDPETLDTLSPLFFVSDPAELPMLILN